MNKRSFLVPLAVSVAALLGSGPNPANASFTAPPAFASATLRPAAPDFVLERSTDAPLMLTGHSSHRSHSSHSSHSSHRSHSSGN